MVSMWQEHCGAFLPSATFNDDMKSAMEGIYITEVGKHYKSACLIFFGEPVVKHLLQDHQTWYSVF